MTLEAEPAQQPAEVADRAVPSSWILRLFPALESRDFRLLWSSSFGSFAGWWMTQLALGWLVLELTNSPFQLGLVSFFSIIPTLIFSMPGGVLADRIDRRKLILITQSATFVLMAILAALVIGDAIRIEIIYLVSFLSGSLMSLNMPARQSLVVEVVRREHLLGAVALNSAMFNVTRIIGPVLAGVFLTQIGNGGTLAIGAFCYLAVVFAVAAMRYRKGPALRRPGSPWRNLVEGVRYSLGNQTILGVLAIVGISTAFAAPYMALLPAYARDVLGLDASGLGLLNAAVGVGALASAGFLAVANDRVRHKGWLLITGSLIFGVLLMIVGFVQWFPLSLLIFAIIGVAGFGQLTLANSLLQMIVPNELRGRVMSLYMLLWGLMPVGTLPLSAIAESHGTPLALAIGGGLSVIGTVILTIRMSSLRRLD
jgi:MFS family permease